AVIVLLVLDYRGGIASADALRSEYGTIDTLWLPALAAAEGAGLLRQQGDRWDLTERGRELVREGRAAARAYLGTLHPIPDADLARLADLLELAFRASQDAPEPAARAHTAWGLRFRGTEPPDSAMVALENAVYGLWMVRDDCHLAAWRSAGLDGPTVEVLTRIWRNEAGTVADLAGKLTQQTADDVASAVERLRRDGLLAAGEPLAVSRRGRALREGIEAETDRLFFVPWPAEVGAQADWIAGRLRAVNAALAPS
ncbi:MAG TPA: hypothetical protein VMJ92_01390, partial [Candidatus Limnocylindrales bacterium]|nr:hypothetical protein [Candidatus Limnocylindrales bacterium]